MQRENFVNRKKILFDLIGKVHEDRSEHSYNNSNDSSWGFIEYRMLPSVFFDFDKIIFRVFHVNQKKSFDIDASNFAQKFEIVEPSSSMDSSSS